MLVVLSGCITRYLAAGSFDWRACVPPPPETGSAQTRREIDRLLVLQERRTEAQVAFVRDLSRADLFAFAAPVFGSWFDRRTLPKTAALFDEVDDEAGPIVAAAKDAFARPRPFLVDARLAPCIAAPGSDAYPSAHAYRAAVWSEMLAALEPAYADALRQRARAMRWSRLVAGVHYPSDTAAGQLLGEAVARKLLESPALQAALVGVRAELAPHLADPAR